MIEIGGKPMIWHIMKIYSNYNINQFIICCGYKGYLIKEYFKNFFLHQSDVTFDMKNNSIKVHQNNTEDWTVTLIDTGEKTSTGGRLKRVKNFIDREENFCFTYGDGLGDINIAALINFHKNHNKQATLTAVRPPGRYGALKIGDNDIIKNFQEKPDGDGGWINGGFFVLKTSTIDLIESDQTAWEGKPLRELYENKELYAFKHHGFWQPMDTLREKNLLNKLWESGNAPWKLWK
jgi:glucose-1-phosphate cytidylyltransferase